MRFLAAMLLALMSVLLVRHSEGDTELSSDNVLAFCGQMTDADPALDLCFDLVHALKLTDR